MKPFNNTVVSYLVQAFKEMLKSFKEQRELLQWFQVFESCITLGILMNSNYFTKRQVPSWSKHAPGICMGRRFLTEDVTFNLGDKSVMKRNHIQWLVKLQLFSLEVKWNVSQ